jgi:hypothetical protein
MLTNFGLPNVLPDRELWDTFKRVAPLPWLFSNKPAALFVGIPVHSLVIAMAVIYFPAGIAPEQTFPGTAVVANNNGHEMYYTTGGCVR